MMLPSLQFYHRHVGSVEEQHEDMVLWMSLLDLSRDEAIQCYEDVSAKRRKWFDAHLKDKDIK